MLIQPIGGFSMAYSWGIMMSEQTVRDNICSGCSRDIMEGDWASRVVGFDREYIRPSDGEPIIGGLIIRCPECSSLFILHTTKRGYDYARENSLNWPKGEDGQPL